MNCFFCDLPIDTDSGGWGYMQEGLDRDYFHLECEEMEEVV